MDRECGCYMIKRCQAIGENGLIKEKESVGKCCLSRESYYILMKDFVENFSAITCTGELGTLGSEPFIKKVIVSFSFYAVFKVYTGNLNHFLMIQNVGL